MTTKTTIRLLKTTAHAAALVFGAFWLVATSAEAVPAKDCFTGIGNPTNLQVVLGAPQTAGAGATGGTQSCQGMDGLTPGTTLTLSLTQGPRPIVVEGCWGYQTTAIQGPTGVTLLRSLSGQAFDFMGAVGAYTSPTAVSCRGNWTVSVTTPLVPDKVVSPLNAGPTQPWFVTRSIDIEQAQLCDGAFTTSGPIECEDSYPITSITQASP
jgi:hypothetical protein